MRYILLVLFFGTILSSCGYTNDKLKIFNNSDTDICYQTLIKDDDGTYFQASAGDCVDKGKSTSPVVRGSIEYKIEQNSIDKVLYIVYYKKKDQEYIFKNIKTIIFNKKFKNDKYSLEKLNENNWKIFYQ